MSLKPLCSHEVLKNVGSFKIGTWEGGFYSEHTLSVTNKQTNTALYNIDLEYGCCNDLPVIVWSQVWTKHAAPADIFKTVPVHT